MEKNYVSFETANFLHATGFPQRTFAAYSPTGELHLYANEKDADFWQGNGFVAAPMSDEISEELDNYTLFKLDSLPESDTPIYRAIRGITEGEASTIVEALARLWIKLR